MGKKTSTEEKITAHPAPLPREKDHLLVEGLRQNNLKNITVRIPHDKITAIAGVSGSGKSSLAFDTLFSAGRWKFLESLSTYTRLFLERLDKPDLDRIVNIRPAIAIEQKNPVRTSRSTVGTATEINDCLRVVFARIGKIHCPKCEKPVTPSNPEKTADSLLSEYGGKPAFIGFTIRAQNTSPFAELLKKGFVRIKIKDKTHDLSEESPRVRKGEEIKVIVDRLALVREERTRLIDSLEIAFEEGEGNIWVEVPSVAGRNFTRLLRCADCSLDIEKPTPLLFSFNHPVGACPECKGFGNILKYDEDKIAPDKELSLREGAIEPWTKPAYTWWQEELERHAENYGIDLDKKYSHLTQREKKILFEGTAAFEGINGFFEYLEGKRYKLHIRVFLSRYKWGVACAECGGTRLKKNALAVKIGGLNIAEVSRMTIEDARGFFKDLALSGAETEAAKEPLRQVRSKLDFLNSMGLDYITLDRLTRTLSGGEAQRVQISNQLGSALSSVLYILDEPSIGLHPRDTAMLIRQMKKLASLGNTLCVVEHDPSIIKAADWIVELGPGAGAFGGRLVWSGPKDEFLSSGSTLTAQYLTGKKKIFVPAWRRKGKGIYLTVKGAKGNNLKSIEVSIPLYTFTCITGVSGSGKSTFAVDTLFNAIASRKGLSADKPLPYEKIEGIERIAGVKLIDQAPIGKTPRSNPITHIGGFDEVRRFFASLRPAVRAGLTAGDFSFNVPGGRCESCRGEGFEKLEMYFLPDVYITCSGCNGKRYKEKILEIRHAGKNIYDVLSMTFDEAAEFFGGMERLGEKIATLRDVGLGYLKLGQPATTLSGGEAQRLKIARELCEPHLRDSLYILDEPTTGLHPDDIKKLLHVLGRLVDSENTVVAVEHNLDFIKTADYIVDLGPDGGENGGRVVAQGPPEAIAAAKESHTGRYLEEALSEQG